MSEGFINPYQFIPLPDKVVRKEALGHTPSAEEAAERYTGSFTVTWKLHSRMAVPKEWECKDGAIRIPGSSFKGAVRSTHEALFGGCLRQVDLDFSPVYRDLPSPESMKGWRLAVVIQEQGREAASDGKKQIVVQLCEEYKDGVLAVEAAELKRLVEEEGSSEEGTDSENLPKTGDLLKGSPGGENGFSANKWSSAPEKVADYFDLRGDYVVLITRQGARSEKTKIRDGKEEEEQNWKWAVGKLTDEQVHVTEEALTKFTWAAFSSRESEEGEISKRENPLGKYRAHNKKLNCGDVVWVKTSYQEGVGQVVTDIKLSQLWRSRSGTDLLRNRIPESSFPCGSHEGETSGELCLSCSVFGSAGADETKGQGQQNSYAGHVRFGSAVLKGATLEEATLAPLGAPSLGAGGMYLKTTPEPGEPKSRDAKKSRWDSDNANDPRQLRGRKFYWHSNPEDQLKHIKANAKPRLDSASERYKARGPHHSNNMTSDAYIVLAGQTFTQRITFDGLDKIGLQSLLAAFEPTRLLQGEKTYALHLGKGKPLGLGSAVAEVSGLSFTSVADRYNGGSRVENPVEVKNVDNELLEKHYGKHYGELGAVHEAAKKILALDGLGDDVWRVTYPTKKSWSYYGGKDFDQSFLFFKDASGRAEPDGEGYRWRDGDWHPMPEITCDSQVMRSTTAKKDGGEKRRSSTNTSNQGKPWNGHAGGGGARRRAKGGKR